jgi:hypothetical protein
MLVLAIPWLIFSSLAQAQTTLSAPATPVTSTVTKKPNTYTKPLFPGETALPGYNAPYGTTDDIPVHLPELRCTRNSSCTKTEFCYDPVKANWLDSTSNGSGICLGRECIRVNDGLFDGGDCRPGQRCSHTLGGYTGTFAMRSHSKVGRCLDARPCSITPVKKDGLVQMCYTGR